ncbi:hypothetical protein DXX93_16805 [Thalassotalea euphylliae]|uniref:Pilus assembly protein n=1 Tax=Thalassotalea euphylliae TaxID=1655234 RepID=A0A3E0TTQ1_9GAMM|nr:hypothetical protein [Thalassotalea euphylliae]REL28056.1 hypothetical protein DXX93_16805 [Thalassotalea euphylliae]
MDKIKAFKYHLALSICVISFVSALIVFFWFPFPFLLLDGTWLPLSLVAVIDLILGPFLTLVLINEQKSLREVCFDFCVIFIIQLSALGYGLSQIHGQKIIALVHLDGVFHLVTNEDLKGQKLHSNLGVVTLSKIPLVRIDESPELMSVSSLDTKLMFNTTRYLPVEIQKIKPFFPYSRLPQELKAQIAETKKLKILVGKKRTSVLIFSDSGLVEGIELFPRNYNGLK